MLGGNFSSKTLNDNWFEDRNQPDYGPKIKFVRPYENDMARAGTQLRVKPNPTWALPDDGFPRYQISKTQEEFESPKKQPPPVSSKDLFIHVDSISEVCDANRRPISNVPRSGFKSVLDHHSTVHKDVWTTAAREQFGATDEMKQAFVTRDAAIKEKAAGVPGLRPAKILDQALVGENFDLCDIPNQRSWMAQEDPGLREFLLAGRKQRPLPAEDNELSLPLGDGAQKEIIESLKARGGKLYRNSTSITTGAGRKNQVSIWDDYDGE